MKYGIQRIIMMVIYALGIFMMSWTIFVFLYQYIAAFRSWDGVLTAFGNARILSALWLSFASAVITAICACIFGVPLAYLFATKQFFGKTAIENLTIDVPQTFPPIAEGIIFLLMLGPDSPFHINIAYTFTALVIAKLFVCAPFVIALTTRKFSEIQQSGLDVVAQSLGAQPLQIFYTIYVPMAFKDIMGGTALCWARAMGELGGSLIFAGVIPFKTEIIPTFIQESAASDTVAALTASIMIVTASIISLFFFKILTRSGLWKVLFYRV